MLMEHIEVPSPALSDSRLIIENGLKKRTHRRAASVPPPLETETSSDEDMEQGLERQELEPVARGTPEPIIVSHYADSMSQSESENSFMSLMDIPELVQSPTHNRRSVIVWDFNEKLVPLDTTATTDLVMSSVAFFNKLLCPCPSNESIEKEDRRTMILNEIITTEQKYITSMKVLLDLFLPSLEEIMGPEDLRLLFPFQLEPLIELHEKLLERLMEGISRWNGIVGDVFGRLCSDKQGEFIALYSAYMNDFKMAMQTLARYENTSPLFCKIASNCSQHPRCEGLSLASFLLTPVQRLPRYELLLKQLLKHTPQDHPDNYSIEIALDHMHSDIEMLDASIQECQFVGSVNQLKKDGTKRSGRKSNRRKRHNSSRFGQIRRHLSISNIDDLRSSRSSGKQAYTQPHSRIGKSVGNLAISVENLSDKMSSLDSQATLANSTRAISFSDVLLLDYEDSNDGQPQLLQENVEEEEELEREMQVEKDTSIEIEEEVEEVKPRSYSPSITSEISIPVNPRASMYSTNSSTSGFGSLGRDEDYRSNMSEDVGTLRHMEPLDSFDSGYPQEKYDDNRSTVTLKPAPSPKKENKLLASALKVFRRATSKDGSSKQNKSLGNYKRSNSMTHVNRYEISQPMDFRHLQHGYGGRPLSMAL